MKQKKQDISSVEQKQINKKTLIWNLNQSYLNINQYLNIDQEANKLQILETPKEEGEPSSLDKSSFKLPDFDIIDTKKEDLIESFPIKVVFQIQLIPYIKMKSKLIKNLMNVKNYCDLKSTRSWTQFSKLYLCNIRIRTSYYAYCKEIIKIKQARWAREYIVKYIGKIVYKKAKDHYKKMRSFGILIKIMETY